MSFVIKVIPVKIVNNFSENIEWREQKKTDNQSVFKKLKFSSFLRGKYQLVQSQYKFLNMDCQ